MGCRSDLERLCHVADLVAFADEKDSEGAMLFNARPDHELVALFEDVQRQGGAREKNGVQWEEGQFHDRTYAERMRSPRSQRARFSSPARTKTCRLPGSGGTPNDAIGSALLT